MSAPDVVIHNLTVGSVGPQPRRGHAVLLDDTGRVVWEFQVYWTVRPDMNRSGRTLWRAAKVLEWGYAGAYGRISWISPKGRVTRAEAERDGRNCGLPEIPT